MTREANIFYNVIASENAMTELLCNFMAYKPLRNLILELINLIDGKDIDVLTYDDFDTQYTLPDSKSRPDMCVINDEMEILIEIKTGDTNLTDNQPKTYLNHLLKLNKRVRILVLLAPVGYAYEAEWNRAVNDFYNKNPDSKIKTKVVYWQDILKLIEHNDLNLLSERVNDFYSLLKRWFEIEQIHFTHLEVRFMYSKETGKLFQKLFNIVDAVKNYNSRDFTVKSRYANTEYGLYFKDSDGQDILYFGIWYELWSEYGCPICFGLNPADTKKNIVKKFMDMHKGECKEMEGYIICCIDPAILEKDNSAEIISKMINEELKSLTDLK